MSVISKIGKQGRILSGKEAGHFIKIEDDTEGSTGGYYVLSWKDDHSDGFDMWFESKEKLDSFFQACGWVIEWPE